MTYAIVQASLDQPDIEAMRRAFAHAPTLAPMDADTLGRDAFGILVKGKSAEVAAAIQSALRAQGIETYVVAERDLPELPATKFVNRVDFTEQALLIYDPLGRSFPVDWKHVMLIAAGSVKMTDFNRIRTERQVARHGVHGEVYYETEVDYNTKEERNSHLVLELVLTGAVARYTLKADDKSPMLFACLGERRTRNLPANFALLVKEFCKFAPHAGLNRGAYYIREDSAEMFAYPTKNAFYEEITWLLWRMRQG